MNMFVRALASYANGHKKGENEICVEASLIKSNLN